VQLVIQIARTGNIGDGRIFVLPLESSYHIRNGFMDFD
jgi:nitrogen regulatory protein PII